MSKRILSMILAFSTAFCAVMLSACNQDSSSPVETISPNTVVRETDDQPQDEKTVMLPEQDVRVISINLAYNNENMEARGELMMPLLLSYEPDSIGTQENGGYTDWLEFFAEKLPNYGRVGLVSSGDPDTSQHQSGNHIFFNADKYNCLDWNTIWLSHTPNFISSYQHGLLRTCTWIILENKDTGFRYVHMNAHLAFENDEFNLFQMKLLQKLMLSFYELGLPVFLTGDFNTSEGSGSYEYMVSADEIADSKYEAEKTMSGGTFRGWGDRDLSDGVPIDFCMITGQVMDVHEYEIIDTYVDGVALSDHCGIFVHATVDSLPDSFNGSKRPSANGIEITEVSNRAYLYEFSFTQATDIHLIPSYHVELFDSSGNEIYDHMIPSRHLDEEMPETKNCTFTCLDPETEYTVKLYAVNLIGAESDPITFSFTTKSIDQ